MGAVEQAHGEVGEHARVDVSRPVGEPVRQVLGVELGAPPDDRQGPDVVGKVGGAGDAGTVQPPRPLRRDVVDRPVDLLAAGVGRHEQTPEVGARGGHLVGERVEGADAGRRGQAEGVREHETGDHAHAQTGEGAGADAADDARQLLAVHPGTLEHLGDAGGEQLPVPAGVLVHDRGHHPGAVVQGGTDGRGRGVDREKHGLRLRRPLGGRRP